MRDLSGNLPPFPAIYPDKIAPVARTRGGGVLELAMLRRGFPQPPKGSRPVTNVRNLKSSFRKPWLKPDQRCLAPVTSFCQWIDFNKKLV